jgi:hypothetical protein
MSKTYLQDIINEAEENIIEDIEKFDGNKEDEDSIHALIHFYIEQKQRSLPNLNTLLKNKSDLYLMNITHGSIYKDYGVVTIPKSLHFFRIRQAQFGSCVVSQKYIQKEIFDDLKVNIQKNYENKNLARQPIRKILHVLKSVQSKLFRMNTQNNNESMKSHHGYKEYKKYSHIIPEISDFRADDKMINKIFSTHLFVVPPVTFKKEVYQKGQLLYNEKIFIASSDIKYQDRFNLLDYLIPDIQCVKRGSKYVWVFYYSMKQIIDLLDKNNIKRCVFVDLSCGNQMESVNNTQTIMNKTATIEGRKYGSFETIRNTIRNKNYQPSKSFKNRT